MTKLQSRGQLGLLSSQGWTGEDPVQAIHMAVDGSQLLAGCWPQASIPGLGLHRVAYICPYVSLWTKGSGRERENEPKRSHSLFVT